MTRAVKVTTAVIITFCSVFLSGCTSNPSGVKTQDPPTSVSTAPTTSSSPASASSPSSAAPASGRPDSSSFPTPTAASSAPTSSATPTPVSPTPSSETPTAATAADPEAANRRAIEAVWTKYWNDVLTLSRTPAAQRQAVMEQVAVPALASTVVAATAQDEVAGRTDFGTATHRPFWATSVGEKSTAVMSDCLNATKSGTLDTKTGKKLSTGGPRNNLRITFVKGAAYSWRVSKVEVIANVQC